LAERPQRHRQGRSLPRPNRVHGAALITHCRLSRRGSRAIGPRYFQHSMRTVMLTAVGGGRGLDRDTMAFQPWHCAATPVRNQPSIESGV
jgi:hypothetical protein